MSRPAQKAPPVVAYPASASNALVEINTAEADHKQVAQEKRRKCLKLFATLVTIAGLILTWVALAELLQVAQHDKGYDKPLFLTYLVHGLYIIFMPIYFVTRKVYLKWWVPKESSTDDDSSDSSSDITSPLVRVDPASHSSTPEKAKALQSNAHGGHDSEEHSYSSNDEAHTPKASFFSNAINNHKGYQRLASPPPTTAAAFTTKRYLWTTFLLHFIFFFCSMTYYYSLNHTSVAANTAIYNSNSIAVFILSVFLLGQKVTLISVLSVLVSVGGICMISFAPTSSDDSNSGTVSPSALGYVTVIVSMILYAVYEVLYRFLCVDTTVKDRVLYTCNSFFVLGMMGFWNIILVWPVFFLANATGWESFEWPPLDALPYLLGAAFVDSVFQILLYIGILLSSPLFISVGCMLSIPGSIVADYLFHSSLLPPLALGGIAVIIVGFLGINYSEYKDHQRQEDAKLFADAQPSDKQVE